jgi:ribulose-phosphate 3-epimerase
MIQRIEISASLICIDWLNMGESLAKLRAAGVQRLHVDIMDGSTTRDLGIPIPALVQARKAFGGIFDYHLMCAKRQHLYPLLPQQRGDTVSFHIDETQNAAEEIQVVRAMGFRPGLAVQSTQSVDDYSKYLRSVDLLTVVAVPLGSIGAACDPHCAARVRELVGVRKRLRAGFMIVADGNVTPARARDFVEAGASILVGGSTGLFRPGVSIENAVAQLRGSIAGGLSLRSKEGPALGLFEEAA